MIHWKALRRVAVLVALVAFAVGGVAAAETSALTSTLFSDPNANVPLGTAELRLTQAVGDPGLFQAVGEARFPAAAEPYTALVITGPDGEVLSFSDLEQFGGIFLFTVDTVLPATVAAQMVGDPGLFTASVFTASGAAGSGWLRLGAPTFRQ